MNKAAAVIALGASIYLVAEAAIQKERSLLAQLVRVLSD